jgi:hypothetical protein
MGIDHIPITGSDDDVVANERPEIHSPFDVESPGMF